MRSLDNFKDDLFRGENSELLKRVSGQNKNLKHRFDEEVISKQNLQTSLKEIYKPITDTQQLTTGEISKQTSKTDVLFNQLLTDLQGKHDRTSRLLTDMIPGLAKSKEETRQQGLLLVSAIAKQPLLPELINELDNYPGLVQKIMQSEDIRELDDEDRKALEPVSHLNDNDLRTLINYYVLKEIVKSSPEDEEDVGAVGGITPPESVEDAGAVGVTLPESVFEEHANESRMYKEVMNTLKKRKPGLNEESKTGKATISPTFYYDANDPNTVKFGKYNVLFKEDTIKINDKEYFLTAGLELLLNRVNLTIDQRITTDDLNTYLNVSRDAGLDYRKHRYVGKKLEHVLNKLNKLDELQKDYEVVGNGLDTIILPDNVDKLRKRLTLLIGEYSAGNKSMFNEINAILDILLKKRIIDKRKVRNILQSINGSHAESN